MAPPIKVNTGTMITSHFDVFVQEII